MEQRKELHMGQQAVGLLYGCEAPKLPVTEDSEEPLYDLLDRFHKASKINWLSDKPRIIWEPDGGKDLLGVWVAVGGSGEDYAPYFLDECVPLHSVEVAFAKQIAKASKLWEKFAKYVAKKEGIVLPKPKLWLTPCETA
jgi:hypothetical protein